VDNQRKLTRAQREALMAERRAEMWRMRVTGSSQQDIADHFGITQSAVSQQLARAYRERPAAAIDEYRAVELDKLDRAERAVLAVMTRRHLTVSAGQIVMVEDADGVKEPLLDDAPVLTAVDRLVKIARHRADLLGLKAPVKVSVEAEQLGEEIKDLVTRWFAGADGDADDGADAGP
jgi:predicted transcriptional regulator